MKTTLEIPDAISRRAMSAAAEHGIPLREFETQAVQEKMAGNGAAARQPLHQLPGSDSLANLQVLEGPPLSEAASRNLSAIEREIQNANTHSHDGQQPGRDVRIHQFVQVM